MSDQMALYWETTYGRMPFVFMVLLVMMAGVILFARLCDWLDHRYSISGIKNDPVAVAIFGGSIVLGAFLFMASAVDAVLKAVML